MEGLEELTLELCDRCPQRCLHCSSNSSPGCAHEVDLDHSLRLIREAAALGTRKLSLGGGEPLLSAHLQQVLDAAARFDMHVEIFTCGVASLRPRLNPIPGHLLQHWSSLAHFKVIFSLQGATEGVHDYVTQTVGSYRILLASLERCLAAGVACEINFVPLRPNVSEFAQLVSLADNLSVRRISVLRFVPQGRGARNRSQLELSREEEDAFVRGLLVLREQSRVEIRTGSPFNGIVPGNHVPCRAGFRKLVIQASGNVIPCEVFKHQGRREWHLSIHETSLAEIMRNASLKELRRRLQDTACQQCPVHYALREEQEAEREYERVPESAVHVVRGCED